jgi:hypothetical protein
MKQIILFLALLAFTIQSCKSQKEEKKEAVEVKVSTAQLIKNKGVLTAEKGLQLRQ